MFWKLLVFLLSLVVAIYVLTNPILHQLVLTLGSLGYLGGFLTGVFYTSTFTAIPATAVFLLLAETNNPFLLPLFGGFGAMCGDYIIYRFFRLETEGIMKSRDVKNSRFLQIIKKLPIIRPLAIVIGAVIVASPFPDEIGIALLGISRLETKRFLPLSFILNTAGIFVIVGVGKIF